jgi:protein-tyrosine-phosphatase
MNVLFVCRGNAGRSQMAEAIFNHIVSSPHHSVSVGTKVLNKDGSSAEGTVLGELAATENVVAALASVGIDVRGAIRKQITEEMVQQADVVVTMAEPETEQEYLASLPGLIRWEVTDPKGMDLAGTQIVLDEIHQKVAALIKELSLETK